ncbi:MAG: ABC transporter substrate-binding protein [Nitrososphaerales archaeon]
MVMIPGKSGRISLVITIAFLLSFSSLVVMQPSKVATVAASQPSTPSLNSITFVDYAGSDASGVADLQANKIDAYDFALTPSASASLPSSYSQYVAPASLYGLYVNPQNTSGGATGQFNPFYFQQVRFALNYLIDRSYFGQTIEGGFFLPSVSAVSAEPDTVGIAGAMAPFSNVTYNFQFANQSIYSTLTAHGVTYTNHQYSYQGKPVLVSLFDRVDDPVRHAFMQYLNSQLQKVGFQTKLIPGDLSVAYSVVFGADPVNATYDIYPASNSQIWGYYDSNAINFYSVYYADLPASDHYGANWIGGFDNTTQEPYSTSLYNKVDTYAIPYLQSNFSTLAQRNDLLANISYYGVLGATYICLGTSLAPYATTGSVTGVTPNFLQDPFSNYQNFMTLSVSASGASSSANALKMGVRHITNGAVNPVGGDDDAYSDNVQQAGALPLYGYGPSVGYPYSTGMTYKINGNSFAGDIAVPSSAIYFNGSSDQWASVAANTKAQDDVTVDVSNLLSHTTWGDGQPVTLADLLMQYIILARVISPGTPISDSGGERGIYTTEYSQVLGIKITNATAVEIWTQGTFYPDANYAAITLINDVLSPLGYAGYTNGLGMTPWQMYYAMSQVVANKQAAWSTATATKDSIPWLNLLNPTDVSNVKAALTAAGSTIPPELTQLQSMSGQSWVTSSTASAGYQAAISFINTNGVAVISDGPFYVSQYSASTSPAFLVMKPNPGFNAGGIADPHLFAPAVVLTAQATIPPVISSGGSFGITVLQTPDGAPSTQSSPASNATVVVQLVGNGTTAFTKTYFTDSSGVVNVQLPTTLKAGSYLLSIYPQSSTSKLIKPVVESLTLTGGSSSSSTSSSTTNPTSSSTSTHQSSSSTSTTTTVTSSTTPPASVNYALVAGIVIIVIIIAGVAAYMLRRGKT